MRSRAKRTGIAVGLELLSAGGWALVSPETLAENAKLAFVVGLIVLAVAWVWDDLVAMVRWRFGRRKLWLETRSARLPKSLPPGADITTLRVMHYGDSVQLGSGDFAHVDSEVSIDYGPGEPPIGVRLAVTNYSDEPLAQTILVFDAKLEEAIWAEDKKSCRSGREIDSRELLAELDRLSDDRSVPTVAYVINETAHFATLFLKEIRVKPFGGKLGKAVVEGKQFSRTIALAPAERFSK